MRLLYSSTNWLIGRAQILCFRSFSPILVTAFAFLCVTGCGGGSSSDVATGDLQENLLQWERYMQAGGLAAYEEIERGRNGEEKLAAVYYDAQRVFQQIGDYTKDPAWHQRAQKAEQIYRDEYVFPSGGEVPGYWNFTRGLANDFVRTGDARSKAGVILLAQKAAYARDSTPLSETENEGLSREVAYAIMSYLEAEKVGESRRERLGTLVAHARGHLRQWTVSESAPYVRPFMVGITAEALIQAAEAGAVGTNEIVKELGAAADWIWDRCWLPSEGAFAYTDRATDSGGREPAPDLNLLIAPLFAWLGLQTGDPRFYERGDQIFIGGVQGAYLGGAKQFHQNYRWSFDYVRWRGLSPGT